MGVDATGVTECGPGGQRAEHGPAELGSEVGGHVAPGKAACDRESEGDGRVHVGAGDVADGGDYDQQGEAERDRSSRES
jgi:hypothetical protein